MGLDIAFNREKAIAAGLVIYTDRVGSDEDIANAKADEDFDQDYVDYLSRERKFIQVPNASHSVEDGGVTDIIVRANKWGSTYYPLTEWLTANGIEWCEF